MSTAVSRILSRVVFTQRRRNRTPAIMAPITRSAVPQADWMTPCSALLEPDELYELTQLSRAYKEVTRGATV